MKLKFGKIVEPDLPHRPGMGKTLEECPTLGAVMEYQRLAERAATKGITRGVTVKCPHCHRGIDLNLIDGLILIPDEEGDPISRPARVIDCPHPAPFCGKQFKAHPPKGYHFETWP
jgi:hypothetical protein